MSDLSNEEILKAAKQHKKNAERHPDGSYLNGWHKGSSDAYYYILRKRMDWDEYRKLVGF